MYHDFKVIEERVYAPNDASVNDKLKRRYTYGEEINHLILAEVYSTPVAVTNSTTGATASNPVANKVYIPCLDDRGTVMGVVDVANGGKLVERLFYNSTGLSKSYLIDENGVELPNQGSSGYLSFGWTGMYREPFTNLYHTHFRDYDPYHERWLSEDPMGYTNGLNLYAAYMGVNYIDPKGDFAFLPFLAYALILTAVDSIVGTSIDAYKGNELTTGGQFKRVGKSFALNSLTAGFAGYTQAAKWGTKAVYGSSVLFDTSVGTAYDTAIEG